ncbi:uncharacterized protein BP01DRAFT_369861 [Aspergillus saccharolyticus JOP 1030-1]|uniref:Uncharacterized protein n=1 Tax=Aspergillus saccharolyticus JOP 1030-1 TaxID=1450539 RepID=A0A318YZK5_9EURO|nr:hypothetical protein BP01DRAFT_369861 [Aspergillus saccharolyticus JOP 1030-1]PYH40451.1 hypothetical protein BP01DRAFT_369861 [Aspergillus saccharolyticus JOP 1030-1]
MPCLILENYPLAWIDVKTTNYDIIFHRLKISSEKIPLLLEDFGTAPFYFKDQAIISGSLYYILAKPPSTKVLAKYYRVKTKGYINNTNSICFAWIFREVLESQSKPSVKFSE